jgi:hypothetical protein
MHSSVSLMLYVNEADAMFNKAIAYSDAAVVEPEFSTAPWRGAS